MFPPWKFLPMSDLSAAPRRSWRDVARDALRPPVLRMLFLGFSAGLPLLLVFGTLSVWLTEAGVSRENVTFFSWAALAYSFKFVWAPLIDRLPLPGLTGRLGRRRAWLLVAQLAVAGALVFTGSFDPRDSLVWVAVGAALIGFTAATQDIIIDAFRIESAPPDLQSMMAATYMAGYRLAMIVAGAGALWLAQWWEAPAGWWQGGYDPAVWSAVYRVMAALMAVGVLTTLLSPEPKTVDRETSHFRATSDYVRFLLVFAGAIGAFILVFTQADPLIVAVHDGLVPALGGPLGGFLAEALRLALAVGAALGVGAVLVRAGVAERGHVQETYIDPITDFLGRYGKAAVLVLALIGTYRIADVVMGVIANVFYLELGFDKGQIATFSKFWGLWASLIGGFVGGVVALRFGVMRTLFLGAILAAVTNVLFAILADMGAVTWMLAVTITADNLAGGMASAAFVAYLSALTSVSFTAVQYALFTSLMTLLPKLIAGYSGSMVDAVGYGPFFIGTAILGLPVALLVVLAARLAPPRPG